MGGGGWWVGLNYILMKIKSIGEIKLYLLDLTFFMNLLINQLSLIYSVSNSFITTKCKTPLYRFL